MIASTKPPPRMGQRRRIRLLNPRSALSTITVPETIRKMTLRRRGLFMPLNLAVCAAVVPPDWEVEIVDENILDGPHQARPDVDVVGIGAMTTQARRAYRIADEYRRLGVTVILGGIHPSALPQEALAHADVVCRGDAEGTLPRALADWERGSPRPIYDWNEQPDAPIATPRKDLLRPADYLIFNPVQTTRGCPHGCKFCTTPVVFGRRFRRRAIDDIINEIAAAKEIYNSRVFLFSDDDIAGNHGWAMDLFGRLRGLKIRWASMCDILVATNDRLLAVMRDSGCLGLFVGLESPRADTLKHSGKGYARADRYLALIRKLHAHRISIWGSFILGFDTEDWRDCMNTIRFAQRADLAMGLFPILTPYPGTAFFEEFRRQGRLLTTDWDRYNGGSVVFQPRRMAPQQLRYAQLAAFHEFYSPRSMLKRLKAWPLKKYSYLANLAVWRGMSWYFSRRGRRLPHFSDLHAAAPDGGRREKGSGALL